MISPHSAASTNRPSSSSNPMKRGKKNSDSVNPVTNSNARTGSTELDAMTPSLGSMKSMGLLLTVLMTASVMFSMSVVLRDIASDDVVEFLVQPLGFFSSYYTKVFQLKVNGVAFRLIPESIK